MKRPILLLMSVSLITFMVVAERAVGDESLNLYLAFDEINGNTIKDLSGKGSDASIEGAPTLEDGKYKQAMQFGGLTDNKLVVAHNPGLNPKDGMITVMAWVYLNDLTEWELAILKWQDEAPPAFSYHFSIHNGLVSLYFAQNDGSWLEAIGAKTLSQNQWHHVAGVADGVSKAKVYLDGEEDGSVAYDGTMLETEVDVCMGGKVAGALYPFHGRMDEVAVFNRALDQDEIKKAMGGIMDFLAVEPQDKLAVAWGAIKS